MRETILKISERHGIRVYKTFNKEDGKYKTRYEIFYPLCITSFLNDKEYINLKITIDKFAEELYSILNVKASQDNEFFID